MMNEFTQYIGIPWAVGADGPDAYDCGAFAAKVYREQFGRLLPAIPVPMINGTTATLSDGSEWTVEGTPEHGDLCIAISVSTHCGVWLDIDGGGVLHCFPGIGGIFTRDSAWRFGRRIYLRAAQ